MRSRPRRFAGPAALAVALTSAALAAPALAAPAPPEPELDRIAVSVVGDGVRTGNEGVPVSIHLLESDGTFVGETGIPYAGDEENYRFVLGADRDQAGTLQLSTDGTELTIGGYDADLGAPTNASTTVDTLRVVGAVAQDGSVDVSTSLAGAFSGSHIRGVAADASRYWAGGHGNSGAPAPYDAGVLTIEAGGDDPTAVVPGSSGQLRNHRVPVIHDGQLYVSSDRANYSGIVQVGQGLPTGTIDEAEFAVIAPTPVADGRDVPHDFTFAGEHLYVAFTDGDAPALVRYAYQDGVWEAEDALEGEFWGMTARDSDAGTVLYATAGSHFGNSVVRMVDDGTLSTAEQEVLAVAEENYAFRGVALAPGFEPGGPVEVIEEDYPADIVWDRRMAYGVGNALSAVLGEEVNPVATGRLLPVGGADLTGAELEVTSSAPEVVSQEDIDVDVDGTTFRIAPTPAGAGTVDLDVLAVRDGEVLARSTLRYWVSVALPSADARAHVGLADASTAQVAGEGYLLVADDDTLGIRLYGPASGEPVAHFAIHGENHENIPYVRQPGETWDTEASARLGDTIFWIGSLGNSRSGNVRPDRDTIAATTVSGSGAGTELEFAGYARGFTQALVEWDNVGGHGLTPGALRFERATQAGYSAEGPTSLNVEAAAIAPDGESLWLGFRSPLVGPDLEVPVGDNEIPGSAGERALIVEIGSIADVVLGGAEIEVADWFTLDLDGRALRGMTATGDGHYALQAGSADDSGNFAIFGWTGEPDDAPVESENPLGMWDRDGSYESLPLVPSLEDGTVIRVLQDVGTVDLYGNGLEAQELPQELQKFYSHDYTLDFAGAFAGDEGTEPEAEPEPEPADPPEDGADPTDPSGPTDPPRPTDPPASGEEGEGAAGDTVTPPGALPSTGATGAALLPLAALALVAGLLLVGLGREGSRARGRRV